MKILVVAAHPDDETLGCGGTLLKWKDQGASLFWAIMTKGNNKRFDRENEVNEVKDLYGMEELFWFDNRASTLSFTKMFTLFGELEYVLENVKPDCVYIPHIGDSHTDHYITHRLFMSTVKPFNMQKFGISAIYSYEVSSSTEGGYTVPFVPNTFVDIDAYLDTKLQILSEYKIEISPYIDVPHPRSVDAICALAKMRGNSVGMANAEAFMLLRGLG